jgi:hypothetical protein
MNNISSKHLKESSIKKQTIQSSRANRILRAKCCFPALKKLLVSEEKKSKITITITER